MSDPLRALFRYDAWANRQVFVAAAAVATDARGEGVTRTLGELLAHIVSTKEGYLHLLRGTLEAKLEERRAWYGAHGGYPDRLRARAEELAAEYDALLDGTDRDRLVRIPWLALEVSLAEALLQVLVHSVEHRADVATILTRQGAEAPKLDLVFWIAAGRP